MTESQVRLAKVKGIIKRHFRDHGFDPPKGLITDIYRALSAAELLGFDECMAIFEPPTD